MSSFTIKLKDAIDIVQASEDNNYGPIGLADYPIFDTDYRDQLNQKIVERYWNREIGMETIDMFTFAIKRKMNEIMPYYNKLYESEQIKFDPISTMDITTKATSESVEDSTANSLNNSNSDTESGSRSVQSTTPQTMLSGLEDYASGASDVNSDSTVTSDSTQDNTANTTSNVNANSNVSGYQGIPANLIMAYRASLLNIDLMVLSDLEECFMLIWDTGDEYAHTDDSNFYYNYYL